MSKIPADLNQTMWDIAERGDAQAAAEFSDRFPAMAGDMRARMNLVGGVKDVRHAIAPRFVPNFRPRYISKPTPRWKRYAPAAIALAALAGASIYVIQNIATPLPDPSLWRSDEPVRAPSTRDVNLPRVQPNPAPPQNSDRDTPMPYSRSQADRRPYMPTTELTPVRIQLNQVHLQNAISGIASKYDHRVEFPPHFPNPVIDVDLLGTNAMNLLNQLGNQYGFTAFDAGDGHIYVLLPSKDGIELKPDG
jgi:hypothetical protein